MGLIHLTEAGCQERRRRVFSRLQSDWALVTSPRALTYLAAFRASPFVFNAQNAGAALLLGRDGTAVLFADNLQEPFTHEALAVETVTPVWYACVTAAPHRGAFLWQAVQDRLANLGAVSLAVERTAVPLAVASSASSEDLDPVLHAACRQKLPDEVAQITECLRVATVGLDAARNEIQPGMTETQAYARVHSACVEAAGEAVLIYGDFASGPRCEQGGGAATARVIQRGDLVLLDFSVVIRGYRGDFANTFVCGAPPTALQRQWSEACLRALQAGEELLQPGRPAREVHAAVRRVFEAEGLAAHFPHHAGHGVGLGHPESPFLVPESDEILAEGDVVTLEPGLYAPGVAGMRFERNYAITGEGAVSLSDHVLTLKQD